MRVVRWIVIAVSALFLGLPSSAQASSIVIVSGPNDVTTQFTNLGNGAMGFGFSTSSSFTNVDIGIILASFFTSSTINFDVYLTNQIGPGTTAATNEIASANLSFLVAASTTSSPYTLTPVTLFQGLTLAAGNYFVTFVQTNSASATGWVVSSPTANTTTTTASGASVTNNFLVFSSDVYPPAGANANFQGSNVWFSVTGTASGPSAPVVPEPASLVLVGLGLAALGGRALQKRNLKSK